MDNVLIAEDIRLECAPESKQRHRWWKGQFWLGTGVVIPSEYDLSIFAPLGRCPVIHLEGLLSNIGAESTVQILIQDPLSMTLNYDDLCSNLLDSGQTPIEGCYFFAGDSEPELKRLVHSVPSEETLLDTWEAYLEAHRAELLADYEGEYVAVLDEKVVDHDTDLPALADRAYSKYGYRPILMPHIARQEPVFDMN